MKQFFTFAVAVLVIAIGIRVASNWQSGNYVDDSGMMHVEQTLYNYECSSSTTCTKTANTYIIYDNGIEIDIGESFYRECQENKHNPNFHNSYCQKIILPGTQSTFTSSENAIKNILKYDGNPQPGPHLDKRIEQLRQKVFRG